MSQPYLTIFGTQSYQLKYNIKLGNTLNCSKITVVVNGNRFFRVNKPKLILSLRCYKDATT